MTDPRKSVNSQFSFESTKKLDERRTNINSLSLSKIQALHFSPDATDSQKLKFIKTLLIKMVTSSNAGNQLAANYKHLMKDLDDDLSTKFSTLFVELESVRTGSRSNNAQSLNLASSSSKFVSTLDPKSVYSEGAPPTSHSTDEDDLNVSSQFSSNYNSRNNSNTDLVNPSTGSDPAIISSLASPKMQTNLDQSNKPNSPSTAYKNNRIHLNSPRIDLSAVNNMSKNISAASSNSISNSNLLSPISLNSDYSDATATNVTTTTSANNPFGNEALNKSITSFHEETVTNRRIAPEYSNTNASNGSANPTATNNRSAVIAGIPSAPRSGSNTNSKNSPQLHGIGIHSVSDESKELNERQLPKLPTQQQQQQQAIGSRLNNMVATSNGRSGSSTPQSPLFSNHYESLEELPDDPTLFIQPKELHTISLKIVTTLSINKNNSSSFDPTFVMATIDNNSQREIWRFKKSYSQLIQLDQKVKTLIAAAVLPHFLELPAIPDRQVFVNNMPAIVDQRRAALLEYFSALFNPQVKFTVNVIAALCKFISTNTVNPLDDVEYNFSNDLNEKDFKKHGYLIRRNKGLGSNWKVRYCKCEGPDLMIYDSIEDGNLLDVVKLVGAQIGRQQTQETSNSEDASSQGNPENNTGSTNSNSKGFRHAMLLKEVKKNSLGSTGMTKHIFCAETDEERDSWIEVLIDYVQPNPETEANDYNELMTTYGSSSTDVDPSSVIGSPTEDHSDVMIVEGGNSKKSRKRFFGGIRNKFGANLNNNNHEDLTSSVTTAIEDGQQQSTGDFAMNAVTDLSYNNTNTVNQTADTTYGGNQMAAAEFSKDFLFGSSLRASMQLSQGEVYNRVVPSIISRSLQYLLQTGAAYQEGIFRLSGSSSVIKMLKEKFETKHDVDLINMDVRPEIDSVTVLLKTYLRKLPENVFTNPISARLHQVQLESEFCNNANAHSNKVKVDGENSQAYLNYVYQIRALLRQLPEVNSNVIYVLLRYLITEVLTKSEFNKMTLKSLIIVFSATFNMQSKLLFEIFVNFVFYFEAGELVSQNTRPFIELESIPLVK